jgi:AraC-like DNA-binding protein
MYLADPKLAIFEVAFLLGYSEPSPFNRAFRRWTGQSPSEFRARLRRTFPPERVRARPRRRFSRRRRALADACGGMWNAR